MVQGCALSRYFLLYRRHSASILYDPAAVPPTLQTHDS